MLKEKSLQFLAQKIQELKTGLFLNQSDAVLKIPSAVINLIKIDDAAQLWFFISRPSQQLSEFEHSFRSKMHFYQKGKDFFIKLKGKACIISDPEDISGLIEMDVEVKKLALSEKVLIKLIVEEIDYYEVRRKNTTPFLYKVNLHLHQLIFSQGRAYRPYPLNQQRIAY